MMPGHFDESHRNATGNLRHAAELSVLFVLIVILLRGFILEGYLISTGSMAPGLRGFHKRIVCPTCHMLFAFGVSFDDSVEPGEGLSSGDDGLRSYATCPNCGQTNINTAQIPNAHGDQLLVQKHVYDFRRPRRWEVVVFRSPQSPGEAFVKRVVGLPGDRLRIYQGDVYVDGTCSRRDFSTQCAMRIPISDFYHLADVEDWQMSWEPDSEWQQQGERLVTAGDEFDLVDEASEPAWIRFRCWRWSGGNYYVETPLANADAQADWRRFQQKFQNIPVTLFDRIEYDFGQEVLRCQGVMPLQLQQILLSQSENEAFRNAVYRLAARSHLAPVTDHYGYNAMVTSPEYPVRDLMLSAVLSWETSAPQITVELPVANQTFRLELQPAAGIARLVSLDDGTALQSGTFSVASQASESGSRSRSEVRVEVSNFDRQIIVAVNGRPCFDPVILEAQLPLELTNSSKSPTVPPTLPTVLPTVTTVPPTELAARTALTVEQQQRWRLGVSGPGVRLDSLRMFRDVYYTPGRKLNGVTDECIVPDDCYFVQGDNSPVSYDSRSWQRPFVPHESLVGKPFFVHLPSYPATLRLGARRIPIRIPDISRIRYIR